MKSSVYEILNEKTREVLYIGQSKHCEQRLYEHKKAAAMLRGFPRIQLVLALHFDELQMNIVERLPKKQADALEAILIADYKPQGNTFYVNRETLDEYRAQLSASSTDDDPSEASIDETE